MEILVEVVLNKELTQHLTKFLQNSLVHNPMSLVANGLNPEKLSNSTPIDD